MNPFATLASSGWCLSVGLAHLRRRVVDGHLDGLAHCADVDHHQDVAVVDLQEETNEPDK